MICYQFKKCKCLHYASCPNLNLRPGKTTGLIINPRRSPTRNHHTRRSSRRHASRRNRCQGRQINRLYPNPRNQFITWTGKWQVAGSLSGMHSSKANLTLRRPLLSQRATKTEHTYSTKIVFNSFGIAFQSTLHYAREEREIVKWQSSIDGHSMTSSRRIKIVYSLVLTRNIIGNGWLRRKRRGSWRSAFGMSGGNGISANSSRNYGMREEWKLMGGG